MHKPLLAYCHIKLFRHFCAYQHFQSIDTIFPCFYTLFCGAYCIAYTILLTAMANLFRFHIVELFTQSHLFKHQRITRRSRFHLCSISRLTINILNHTATGIAFAYLLNKSCLILNNLPLHSVHSLFSSIAQDFHFKAVGVFIVKLITLPNNSPLTLLKVRRSPRRI